MKREKVILVILVILVVIYKAFQMHWRLNAS